MIFKNLLKKILCYNQATQLESKIQTEIPRAARNIFRTIRAIIIFIIILIIVQQFNCLVVIAKDFGIQGHTFPIVEENILKVIEQRLLKIDLNKLNAKLKDKTEKYVENPPSVKGISKARETKVKYYDPTFVVPEDVYDHNGLLIAPAGKRINPLELTLLTQPLIFIDGDDEEQVSYAMNNAKAKIILVKGSPLKLQRKYKRWIYFDQAGVIAIKLDITEVPAVLEQDGLQLKITIGGTTGGANE